MFVTAQVGSILPEPSSRLDPDIDHGLESWEQVINCLVDVEKGPYYTGVAPTLNISTAALVARFKAVDP